MNAIQFIQKHGVKRAKECLPAYEKHYCGLEQLFVEDLKRLVESVDLIGKFGGFKRAERILKKSYKGWSNSVSVVWNDKPFQCSISQLEQAIADYEQLFGNTETLGGEHV
ncbi:hypothetical protein [Acinetobacter sp. IK40]|uniref:hypothetical protein n=1 Tax=Acinetobacter sp. IK40 TaxID=2928897 RepID=UPI002D1E5F07|nr:hypothetical protein [Acinetobacter sp. IK40]MEB3790124.1 hypothetical protein [Acinetobacter sp. IK40]